MLIESVLRFFFSFFIRSHITILQIICVFSLNEQERDRLKNEYVWFMFSAKTERARALFHFVFFVVVAAAVACFFLFLHNAIVTKVICIVF